MRKSARKPDTPDRQAAWLRGDARQANCHPMPSASIRNPVEGVLRRPMPRAGESPLLERGRRAGPCSSDSAGQCPLLAVVSCDRCNTWLAARAAGVLRMKRSTRIQQAAALFRNLVGRPLRYRRLTSVEPGIFPCSRPRSRGILLPSDARCSRGRIRRSPGHGRQARCS